MGIRYEHLFFKILVICSCVHVRLYRLDIIFKQIIIMQEMKKLLLLVVTNTNVDGLIRK